MVAAPSSGESPISATPLYRTVWRWHLIAGILVAPLLVVLAVTGFIYLFQTELEGLVRPTWHAVSTPAATTPIAAQVTAATATVPGGTATSVLIRRDPIRPTIVNVPAADGMHVIFVDPATATVVGATTNRITDLAIQIHSNLLLGAPGRVVLELAACWGLMLIGTGLFMWFPRGVEKLRGVLIPRLRTPGRNRWRDLHAVPAMLTAFFAAFLLLSGLPWTIVWGDLYDRFTHSVNSAYPVEVFYPHPSKAAEGRQPITVDQALAQVRDLPSEIQIDLPSGELGSYHIRQPMGSPPEQMHHVFIDQYAGSVLLERGPSDVGALAKPVAYGVSLHMGKYFGLPNQILSAVGCLGVLWMTITGVWLWWTRRPAGGLGLPAALPWAEWPRWVKAMVVIVGIALPLLGASIVVCWLLDRVLMTMRTIFRRSGT